MRQVRCFFDLDDTLYDTDCMFAPIRDDMEELGFPRERVLRIAKELSREGYSFEEHLFRLGASPRLILRKTKEYRTRLRQGDAFLFPGVVAGMERLSTFVECLLLTYGYPPYQADKVAGIKSLQHRFEEIHYVWQKSTKAQVIACYEQDMPTYFIDNSPDELVRVYKDHPWVRLIRITWPHLPDKPHPQDNLLWQTVRSFEELEGLLEHNHPNTPRTNPPAAR